MIFTVDGATARWIQKTVSRFRCKGDWANLAAREACWTPALLSALIDEVDFRLTVGRREDAFEISRHLPQLAERIRAEDCPKHELDKRSLVVWAMAVHASSHRACQRLQEAESQFQAAFGRARAGVAAWAQGDLARRYAILVLGRGDSAVFSWIEKALSAFAEFPDRLAETLILRGAALVYLRRDNSAALADFSRAASLLVPLHSERARFGLFSAFHNIARQLVADPSQSLESLSRARKLIQLSRRYFGQGFSPRKLVSIWVEGILVYRMGWNRHGERLLERAREGFRKLKLHDEFVMATLDLALLLQDDGEPERVQEVLVSAAEIMQERYRNAPQSCAVWKPTLEKEEILQIRQAIQDQLRLTWRQARSQARARHQVSDLV